ncbi:hypothetical protein K435DRAFT_799942 [Dendrothele bispora CBS 962.96]|uniref:Uncharacterized protein n=1 Tax=Dendrothele bispora (strain CBS 962.96) TaxID=1314807 RepID=A0A4S8LUY1_DENBC|nr:hypothetical protein K435DRAFT_799942 [Dendrothele bispora CBS 962.96]
MSHSSTEEQFLPIFVSYLLGDHPFLIHVGYFTNSAYSLVIDLGIEWYPEDDDDHIQCALSIIVTSARHFSEEVLEYPKNLYAVMVPPTFVYRDNPDERGTCAMQSLIAIRICREVKAKGVLSEVVPRRSRDPKDVRFST